MKVRYDKGFTIVELIGIILILALIFLVSFPAIQSMGKSDSEKKYNQMVDSLCLAGKSYISSNLSDFSNLSIIGQTAVINIDELISYGSVDANLKNPRTNHSVSGDTLIYTVSSDYSLDCTYQDN